MNKPLTLTVLAPVMSPVRNRKTGKSSVPSHWLNSNQMHLKRLINPGIAGFSGRIRAAPASAGNTRQGLTPSLVLAERGCHGFYIHHA